jgi:hypothetical protein
LQSPLHKEGRLNGETPENPVVQEEASGELFLTLDIVPHPLLPIKQIDSTRGESTALPVTRGEEKTMRRETGISRLQRQYKKVCRHAPRSCIGYDNTKSRSKTISSIRYVLPENAQDTRVAQSKSNIEWKMWPSAR